MKISLKNRKIGYTHSSVSGSFPFRGEKSISFESTLERDLLAILEYDPNVIDVVEQPVTIEYTNKNGRDASYTPDFLVTYQLAPSLYNKSLYRSLLIEVKPRAILKKKWAELKPKFQIGTSYAKQEGWKFCIYDESRIRADFLENIKFLKRYKNHRFDSVEEERIVNHVSDAVQIGIDNLLEFLYFKNEDKDIALKQVRHLISKRILMCDMRMPLTSKTTIWVNEGIVGEF